MTHRVVRRPWWQEGIENTRLFRLVPQPARVAGGKFHAAEDIDDDAVFHVGDIQNRYPPDQRNVTEPELGPALGIEHRRAGERIANVRTLKRAIDQRHVEAHAK